MSTFAGACIRKFTVKPTINLEHRAGAAEMIYEQKRAEQIDAVSRVKLPVYYDFSLSSVRKVNYGTFLQI